MPNVEAGKILFVNYLINKGILKWCPISKEIMNRRFSGMCREDPTPNIDH